MTTDDKPAPIHYNGGQTACGIGTVDATTDTAQVTCPECLAWIEKRRAAVRRGPDDPNWGAGAAWPVEFDTEQRPLRATRVAMTAPSGSVSVDPGVGFKGKVHGVRIVDVAPIASSTGGAAEHPVPWRVLHVAERTTEMDAVRWAGLRLWSITAETGKAETATNVEATIEAAPEAEALLREYAGSIGYVCQDNCAHLHCRTRRLLARIDAAKAGGR
jgi:hypothetical protein